MKRKVKDWRDLTLREKIGQTVISLCETDKHIQMCGSIEKFLEKYPIGGMYNNGGLVKGLLVDSHENYKEVISEYNKHLSVPLFPTGDFGIFAAKHGIDYVPQMAVGATNDAECAYKMGEFRAEDFKHTGIMWGFWPVCDISPGAHADAVTGARSIGQDIDLIIKMVKEELKAMKERGVIASIKHFPGHDLSAKIPIDPHLGIRDNKIPFDLWKKTYGKIYKELIDAGVPTIMVGHENLIDYQTEKINGEYPSATMSYEVITKLLREELGFKGVVVTDALVMGGFGGAEALNNTVLSFLAGHDCLLWPAYEYIDEMEKRILSGEIDEKLLDASVERIWNLKKEYGLLDEIDAPYVDDVEFYREIEEKITEKSLTLLNNYNDLLPLKKENVKNVFIVGVTPDDGEYEKLCKLKSEFEKYGMNVTMQRNVWTDEIEKAGKEYDLIVFALCRNMHRPIGPLDFWAEEATSIWSSNCSDKTKTVIANFGVPYMYKYYEHSKYTYIDAYSPQGGSVRAVVKAIFGEIGFEGKSPVQL